MIAIELLSGGGSGVDTVVNVATVVSGLVRFGAVVLIEKLVFNVAREKIGVAGSHFGAHGHAIDFSVYNNCQRMKKQFSVKTSSARRGSVSELGSLTVRKSKNV